MKKRIYRMVGDDWADGRGSMKSYVFHQIGVGFQTLVLILVLIFLFGG